MRLTQLRSFHAVARAGGFTGGAKLLHISQPTVTTQVRFLEETYGIELFYRRGHKVTLTPLGEQLYEMAQKHLRARERDGAPAGGLGRAQVGAPARRRRRPLSRDRDAGALQPALSRDAGVGARRQLARRCCEALVDYQTDVAVLAQFTDDPRFHSVPYSRHPIVVFVHRAHRFAGRKSIRIAELDGEGMILREEGSTTRKALDDALAQAGVDAARR